MPTKEALIVFHPRNKDGGDYTFILVEPELKENMLEQLNARLTKPLNVEYVNNCIELVSIELSEQCIKDQQALNFFVRGTNEYMRTYNEKLRIEARNGNKRRVLRQYLRTLHIILEYLEKQT